MAVEQVAISKRQLEDWDHLQEQMTACDQDLQAMMKQLPTTDPKAKPAVAQPGQKKKRRRGGKARNEPNIDLAGEWKRVTGVDLTRIDWIKVGTAQTVFSEAGFDMSKWPTEHHFASWIGLCPARRRRQGRHAQDDLW